MYLQKPANGPYSEPDESGPHLPTTCFKIHFNNIVISKPKCFHHFSYSSSYLCSTSLLIEFTFEYFICIRDNQMYNIG